MKPEDILPDGVDSTILNGRKVRKGTIAAFLANTDVLNDPKASKQQKQQAIQTMKELAPAILAIGLHQHVTFKNEIAERILIDATKV